MIRNPATYADSFTNPEKYVMYNMDQKAQRQRANSGNNHKTWAVAEGVSEIILNKVLELGLKDTSHRIFFMFYVV